MNWKYCGRRLSRPISKYYSGIYCGRRLSWPISKYYSSIYLEVLI